jgi:hypothetical protein
MSAAASVVSLRRDFCSLATKAGYELIEVGGDVRSIWNKDQKRQKDCWVEVEGLGKMSLPTPNL